MLLDRSAQESKGKGEDFPVLIQALLSEELWNWRDIALRICNLDTR
jgi:hypothetical protein